MSDDMYSAVDLERFVTEARAEVAAAERERIRQAWDEPPNPREKNQPIAVWRAKAVLAALDGMP